MTSWVGRLGGLLRALANRMHRRRPPARTTSTFAPTKFADTQDLLDDIRATGQTRGVDVRESELDHLPADVQRHFEISSTGDRD